MPITLDELARTLRLPVLAGDVSKPVGWVHGTELADPTPFVEGGELLLTTGLTAVGEGYVERLVRAGVVGLGFGTGLGHDVVPVALVEAAERAGLGLVEVPREVPFIAISKAVSKALAADEYAALTRTSEAQRALSRAAVRAGVGGVVRRLGQWINGWVVLLDAAGEPVHAHNPRLVPDLTQPVPVRDSRPDSPRPAPARDSRPLPDLTAEAARLRTAGGLASAAFETGGWHVFLQMLGSRARGQLAVGTTAPLDAADLSIVNTAASLLTLALAQNDAVDAAQRELRSGQFRLLLAGLPVEGLPERFRVFIVDEPPDDVFWAEHEGHVVALTQETDGFGSSEVDVREVARGYREAQQAKRAGIRRFEDFAGGGVTVPDGFVDALLRPLDEESRATLRVWLAHHGAWDPAAAELGVHRHTLRNRVRKAEQALNRSMDSPGLRAELWLALNRP
ncbi:PucR family transcriptional regulator ligand-binding domain-containing protein [Lentzea sp. BCCO 10_0856]|uniref:PucR family transcriptional regulator ligand-binding domain-containing protein n=1 Tax=Lentzea miocenica TaxID=3095431 RepID=A0ABU4TDY2_9PSEU|nr:PucR family transcriptional regulator ligand-binding domain-containing protein [Lentzea sp. BCCO 10_0856]MDX8036389.1 PucR family transcriptional regulator ligand-binding domain-containing protein [Lentzea sp. BCCO 10_0856]